MITISPCRSAKCPGTSLHPSLPKKYGPAMSSASATAHTPACASLSRNEPPTKMPTPTVVLPASVSTEWRRSGASRLAIMKSPSWAYRTAAYASANSIASPPKPVGTASAAMSIAAMAAKITIRTASSSGSTTLVIHE
jgi:hypothetical protein